MLIFIAGLLRGSSVRLPIGFESFANARDDSPRPTRWKHTPKHFRNRHTHGLASTTRHQRGSVIAGRMASISYLLAMSRTGIFTTIHGTANRRSIGQIDRARRGVVSRRRCTHRHMKVRTLILSCAGLVVLYVLSAGPAQRWSRSAAWPVLVWIYTPIYYLDEFPATSRLLRPYWDLWADEHSNIRVWG